MNNKFLEYLLEEKLKDITYHVREISSEREKRYSKQEEEYPYIDDMLQFFLDLNVSQEDLFHAIRKEKASYSLADILFGYENQNDKNRESKINTFKPLIEGNVNFYKQMMKVFLSDHDYIREEFKEKNTKIFEQMVDIGIKKGFFQYFQESEIQTKNAEYKKVLIEKEVFNTDYNFQDTINLLAKKEKEIANHFSMYSESIHKELESLDAEKFQNIKDNLIKTLKIEESKQESEIKNKFNDFLYYLISIEKETFLPLLNNPIIRENIIFTDRYSNNALNELVLHPQLLEGLLKNTQEHEKFKLFKKEKYTEGSLIKLITESSRDKMYIDENLLSNILENIEHYVSDNEEEDNKKELVMAQIIFNQTQKCKNQNYTNKLFEKYTKTIVKALSAYDKSESYFKYGDRLIKFNQLEDSLDSVVYNKITSKLQIAQKDMLYKFSQMIKSKHGNIDYKDKQTLEGLTTYINITKDISVLNVLNADPENPEWKNLTYSYSNGKSYYEKENIIVYLLKNIQKEEVKLSVIEWVMEESIQHFYDLKFGNKEILSHYKKEGENTKNKNGLFVKIIDKILENEIMFDTLLRDNKVKMKLVQSIDNEEVQKKLSYHLLRDKLTKTNPETVKVKNKTNKI